MKKITFIVLYSTGILLYACRESKPNEGSARETKADTAVADNVVQLTPEQVTNAGITAQPAGARDMHTVLKVNGVIDVPPQNIVSVSIPLGGYLKGMKLLPGMQVSKGQVLAVLEDPQYVQLQQDYLVARSRLRYLEADFARQRELNESKANSDKVFQQAKSEFESQQVMARSLGEKLRLIGIDPEKLKEDNISRSINLYAPIGGFVKKVNVNIGKYVSPTDVLFELIDPADIHLSLTVFEKDVLNLAPEQRVVCYPNNRPAEKHTAAIHLITRDIDERRSAEVHCHFEQYDKRLLPGMFMNAEIELEHANVTAVPDDAVVKWGNKPYVFIAAGKDRFVMTPVETGPSNDGYTEIKTAINGKEVVTGNAYALLMKMKNAER